MFNVTTELVKPISVPALQQGTIPNHSNRVTWQNANRSLLEMSRERGTHERQLTLFELFSDSRFHELDRGVPLDLVVH